MNWQEILNQITQTFGGYIPKLIGAVAILIIGWFVALIVAAIVRGGLRRTTLDNRLAKWLGMEDDGLKIERKVGKGVYYLIAILVLVAFFQVLGLTLATGPLNQLLTRVLEYIPRLIGAGLVLVIAWILATILRLVVLKGLRALQIDERLGGGEGEEKKSVPLAKTISDALYWLIILIFLPAVLGALGLSGLLIPIRGMVDKVLGFLPNIFIAGIIGVVGWFVARVVRQLVTSLLSAIGIDNLSERVGLAGVVGEQKLSGIIGLIVYIFVLIPVILASLNALALQAITEPTSNMLNIILKAIPSIFAASLVLIIAYIVGRIVSGLIANLLTGIGFNGVIARIGLWKEPAEGESAEGKRTPATIVGYLIIAGIMLFAVTEAASLLKFTVVEGLISQFLAFAGRIIIGVIIFGVGLYFASLAAKAIQASKTTQPGLLSMVARVAILALTGAMALRQMGLANEIINMAFALLLGAMAVAVAIAFGIGGREIASRKLDEWTESIKSEEKS